VKYSPKCALLKSYSSFIPQIQDTVPVEPTTSHPYMRKQLDNASEIQLLVLNTGNVEAEIQNYLS